MKRLLSFALALVAGVVLFGSGPAHHVAAISTPPAPVAAQRPFLGADGFVPNFIGDWPPEAKAAWDMVASALAAHIGVTVPVEVDITWKPLDGGFLGMGGSLGGQRDFDHAPMQNTWYPIALANQLAGTRLAPGPDIGVDMASNQNWDYSGKPQQALKNKQPDFVSTLMHEIIHGMGFLGSANVSDDQGQWGDDDGALEVERHFVGHAQSGNQFVCTVVPASYTPAPLVTVVARTTDGPRPEVWDQFVVNGKGQAVLNTDLFANPSTELKDYLTSGDLFWNGDGGTKANGGKPVRLYSPPEWEPASSYSHLDDKTYDGGPDALLTSAGEDLPSIEVGPRVLGMLADLGWHIH